MRRERMSDKRADLVQQRERADARRARAQAAVLDLDRAIALEDALDTLEQGHVVDFIGGRGETRRSLCGTVLGVDWAGKDFVAKVFVGDGLGAEIKTVRRG